MTPQANGEITYKTDQMKSSWTPLQANPWLKTQQEADLLDSLRERKHRERLILSDSEFAQCLVIARRKPRWRDRSDAQLMGSIIGNLI